MIVNLKPETYRTDAIQQFLSQETIIVRITDSNGICGTGYSYTIGTGGKAVFSLIEDVFINRIIGKNADNIEGLWQSCLFSSHATCVGAITSLALAAIDTALWDIRAQKAKLPLYQLLGGARQSIPLYSTEGGWLNLSIDELVSMNLGYQKQGFKGAKIKIGCDNPQDDYRRLSAVRKAVGDDFIILVDANQSMSLSKALARVSMLEEMNIGWFEEPFPADDVQTHKLLAQQTNVPIAVGESMYSLSQFKEYLVCGAASIVQVDVARVGGITPWLKVAHMAEAFNVTVCPHFLMELHLSLVCAIPNSQWLEYIPQLQNITKTKIKFEGGIAYPPRSVGLGIDWDWDIIKQMRSKDSYCLVDASVQS
ncbi:MAG: mandelate racemase/muconate lactonizing enzyme family protein [Niabella sp.]